MKHGSGRNKTPDPPGFFCKIQGHFGPNMWEMYLNNTFNGFIDFFCFILVQSNPDFIILEALTSKFHDFSIFGPTINGLYWPINSLIGQ